MTENITRAVSDLARQIGDAVITAAAFAAILALALALYRVWLRRQEV